MNKLKNRWGISSNSQLSLILLVFAINGSLSGIITKPILSLIGVNKENVHLILYWFLYILAISVVYFSLLIIISKLFGQSSFFKKFAKQSLSPLGFKRFF
ncbi:MAG: DUF6787 family protein [Flavobacteriaceae bacterium]